MLRSRWDPGELWCEGEYTSKDHAGARGRSYKLNKYWSTELSPVLGPPI
jgi:hypothetical protein